MMKYPEVLDPSMVGEYSALSKAGGGYVWDAVLEYRVWFHDESGDDYYYVFDNAEGALDFCSQESGAESPLALILQREYIDEPEQGKYIHVKEERITEWPIEFLRRPKRTKETIPDFLAPNAPANKLDIIRGFARKNA
ncbi:GCN5 family acetyltransferase [Vibrio vulnificus]|uniref:GCN5 family acetyltransferase n=2 Tax=Vibrionaceae TaxID=641 RepID=A0ABX4WVN2_VIBVL|nr:GCN5 family acetyltransferase [Vibrio vulnificus Env1]EGQ9939747.1 GCN5 family acetyltransferase [Vibrio vulnificus]KGK12912.1 GCN5 family acetyltransferase [Vibrio navarrensis]KYN80441.1 GCN5 family acetyltransferase [Vibrio cidicii]ODY59899.1 GCN5 family acetyltransferase [Vibrio parahaemolyticus]